MEIYIVPVTFPDLDTAKRDAASLVDALQTAGVRAEVGAAPELESGDDSAQTDPGPTTRELRVHASGEDEAGRQVQEVVEGQFPPGMVLLGRPTKA
ncbi:hypothetical protein GCM10023169_22080 [Georgenia halophila]|uniref:Uncharacterized protein n=1 Tax=Georgenia halophila TaxID=620889 RepID=A0ABP8L8L9_9MICO